MSNTWRIFLWLALLASLCFAGWLTLFEPVIGYANNFDFIRQSACVGIWHNHPEINKLSASPVYPAESFIYDGERIPHHCVFSSDNLFIYLLSTWYQLGDEIPRWHLGLLKLLLTVTLCGAALLGKSTTSRVPAVLWLTLLGFEWGLVAYGNTFFSEYSVLLGFALVAVCGAQVLMTRNSLPVLQLILLIVALLYLGLTKFQWNVWAGMLVAGFTLLLILQGTLSKKAILPVAIALLYLINGIEYWQKQNLPYASIHKANTTNTYLYTVLPVASDLPAALATLRLPAHCAVGVGQSWYSPGMEEKHLCPEVANTSRARLLALFVSQPRTFIKPIKKTIDILQDLAPDHLGVIAPAHPESARKLSIAKQWAPSHWLGKLPKRGFRVLVILVMLAGPLAYIVLCHKTVRNTLHEPSLYWIALGSLTCSYSLLSSVYGDGYFELHRHAILFWPGLYAVFVGVVYGLSKCLMRFRAERIYSLGL